MSSLRAWYFRIGGLFDKDRKDRELSEEVDSHIQMHTEDNVRAGMSPAEARRQALLKLGGVEQTKEKYRDRRGLPFIESIWQDICFGIRMLRKNLGFTAVAVLTIALGIGANTAIFSVVNAALLRPLPFPQQDRLVELSFMSKRVGLTWSVSYPNFVDWQRENRTFENLAAFRNQPFNLEDGGRTERLSGKMVSAAFFPILGVQPVIGRNFSPSEDQLGAPPVALISERVWKNHFDGSSGALGKAVTLDGKAYTIIGVISSQFLFNRVDDVFVPIGQWDVPAFRDRGAGLGMSVVGRTKAETTLAEARSDMNRVSDDLAVAYPQSDADTGIISISLKRYLLGDLQPALLILLGAVGFVLLIACTNVGSLMLARSSSRSREFALRSALGAKQKRLIRQLLTESLLLSLIGGTIGTLVAIWGTPSILRSLPVALPNIVHVDVDVRVLLFALLASVCTGIFFGLAPALHASRLNPQEALQEAGRGATAGRQSAQQVLVVTEIALTAALLVGAILMIRSMTNLWNVNPGFDAHNVLTFGVSLPPTDRPDGDAVRAKHREIISKLDSLPGVEVASITFGALPLDGQNTTSFWPDGQPKPAKASDRTSAINYQVSPGYFRALRIPLLRGRYLTEEDNHTAAPVMIVDDKFAAIAFPRQDALGKRVYIGDSESAAEIVGIVGHVKQLGLDGDDDSKIQAQLYTPVDQIPDKYMALFGGTGVVVVLRTSVAPTILLQSIRDNITRLDSREVTFRVRTMDEITVESQARRRFSMFLLAAFATVALLLATVGIYGVLSYLVNQKTREIGIRLALGARPRLILESVIGNGVKLAVIGVCLGVAGSLALTRVLLGLLYGVTPTDPITFITVVLLLLGITLLACYIPARRATTIDPMVALRYE